MWWIWVIAAIVLVVLGIVALTMPDIRRYLRMRRM